MNACKKINTLFNICGQSVLEKYFSRSQKTSPVALGSFWRPRKNISPIRSSQMVIYYIYLFFASGRKRDFLVSCNLIDQSDPTIKTKFQVHIFCNIKLYPTKLKLWSFTNSETLFLYLTSIKISRGKQVTWKRLFCPVFWRYRRQANFKFHRKYQLNDFFSTFFTSSWFRISNKD